MSMSKTFDVDAAKLAEAEKAAALIPEVEEQESTLRFKKFSAVEAFEIGCAIRARFLERRAQGEFPKRGIVISISTMTRHTLFVCACGDESAIGPGNWEWVEGKTAIVAKHNHSSYLMGRKSTAAGEQRAQYAHGGGFPVWMEGAPSAPYAIIVVSGLAEEDDHELIVDVLKEYIPKQTKRE